MKVFVAASYSSKVNYDTGEVFPEFKAWLEALIGQLEAGGHEVFCSLRHDGYRINDRDPAAGLKLDFREITAADAVFALVESTISAGVQVEIGYSLALNKKIVLAHKPEDKLAYINHAMVTAGVAAELLLPFDDAAIRHSL